MLHARWWFQTLFISTLAWVDDPILLTFFKWVETTNQHGSFTNLHSLQLTVGTCQETTPKANQPSIYLEFSGAMLVSGRVNPMIVDDETPYAHMSVSEHSGFSPNHPC